MPCIINEPVNCFQVKVTITRVGNLTPSTEIKTFFPTASKAKFVRLQILTTSLYGKLIPATEEYFPLIL
jgi:hypothetical protein